MRHASPHPLAALAERAGLVDLARALREPMDSYGLAYEVSGRLTPVPFAVGDEVEVWQRGEPWRGRVHRVPDRWDDGVVYFDDDVRVEPRGGVISVLAVVPWQRVVAVAQEGVETAREGLMQGYDLTSGGYQKSYIDGDKYLTVWDRREWPADVDPARPAWVRYRPGGKTEGWALRTARVEAVFSPSRGWQPLDSAPPRSNPGRLWRLAPLPNDPDQLGVVATVGGRELVAALGYFDPDDPDAVSMGEAAAREANADHETEVTRLRAEADQYPETWEGTVRWLDDEGFVGVAEGLRDEGPGPDESTIAAVEGTLAHNLRVHVDDLPAALPAFDEAFRRVALLRTPRPNPAPAWSGVEEGMLSGFRLSTGGRQTLVIDGSTFLADFRMADWPEDAKPSGPRRLRVRYRVGPRPDGWDQRAVLVLQVHSPSMGWQRVQLDTPPPGSAGALRPGARLRSNPGTREVARIARALASLAEKLSMLDLGAVLAGFGSIEWPSGPPGATGAPESAPEPPLEDLEADPYHETAATRRNANIAALRILRAHQADRARPRSEGGMGADSGPFRRPATPEERRVLRQYSGWGGIEPSSIPAADWSLLQPAQAEYLRIDAERTREKARIAEEQRRVADESELTPFGRVRGAWQGLIAQYFTPVEVCEGMLDWARTAFGDFNRGRPGLVLEPSAGVGRMVRAWQRMGGSGASWDAVELDPDLADIMRLLYEAHAGPTPRWGPVSVFNESYEAFAQANPGAQYDLIAANPPYGPRGATSRQDKDKGGKAWKQAQHYALWRMARMLAPRGVMVVLTPHGVITSDKGEQRKLREDLLKECHFIGAVRPPYEVFPGALLSLSISLWAKRPKRLDKVLPADRDVLEGRYFDDPRFAGGVMGVTRGSLGEVYRPEAITGTWDAAVMLAQPKREPPPSFFAEVKAASPERAAVDAALGMALDDDVAAADTLGARVLDFRQLRETDPARAAAGQDELRKDLADYWRGMAGNLTVVRRSGRTPERSALLSVFDGDGRTPELDADVAVPLTGYAGPAGDLRRAFLHYAQQRGEVTAREMSEAVGREVTDAELLLLDGAWPMRRTIVLGMVTGPDGETQPGRYMTTLVYRRAEEAFTGALWPVLDWTREALAGRGGLLNNVPFTGAQAPLVREKLTVQRDRLVAAIDPVPIGEIDIGLRSNFVHAREGSTSFDCPLIREWLRDEYKVDLDKVHVVDGWLEVEPAEMGRLTSVGRVLAYWNREEKTYDGTGRGRYRQDQGSLEDRIAEDRQMDERYAAFVRRAGDVGEIEERYNRSFRGYVPRVYSNDPLPLARLPAEAAAKIRAHGWPAVRRAAERRGGIMALDVGLGKTLASMLAMAWLRQQGKVRRAAFVVPNTVGPNWLAEFGMWLPGFRVLPVGFTLRRDKAGIVRSRKDSPTVIRDKLNAFASGRYDVMVIQHSTWERIPVDMDRAVGFFAEHFGASREAMLQRKRDERTRDAIDELKRRIDDPDRDRTTKGYAADVVRLKKLQVTPWLEELGDELALVEAQLGMDAPPHPVADLKKRRKKLKAAIKKWAAKSAPTDRERAEDENRLEKWIERRVEPAKTAIEGVTFGQLGIDFVVVDEAHEFKNLYGPQTRYGQKAKYMGAMSADAVVHKAWDMWLKCRLVRESRDDTGVLLLTATPMKNSPLEAYNLLSYVTTAAFERRGLLTAEDFIDRYCQPESQPVLTVKGAFREDLAVLRFSNLHELRGIFDVFVDVKFGLSAIDYAEAKRKGEDLRDVVQLPLPQAQYITAYVRMDPEQEAFYSDFRSGAAQAAEEAAKRLCDVNKDKAGVKDVSPPEDTGEPRARLPKPKNLQNLAELLKLVHADHRQLWKGAMQARGLDTLPDWAAVVGAAGEDGATEDGELTAWLWDRYGALADYIEANDVRGTIAAPAKTETPEEVSARLEALAEKGDKVEEDGGPAEGGGAGSKPGDLFKVMDTMSKAALDTFLLTGWSGRTPPKYRKLAEVVKGGRVTVGHGDEATTMDLPVDCGHVIFCDFTQAYPRIVNALVAAGVKRNRIEVVSAKTHDVGQRQDVSRRLNGGELDVVIGGRAIEQGINLQRRSCGLHHLTFPWEPATIQQRNGRVVRQGNRLGEVFVWFYPALKSFDGYRLSLILGKRAWMRTLLTSADRNTNNPAADLTGPCSVIKQLSSNPAKAAEFCECLERAAELKAVARRREQAMQDFAKMVAYADGARRDGPRQAHFAEQAAKLRARLLSADPDVFDRRDLVERAGQVPLWWDTANGVVWVQGDTVCVAGQPCTIVTVDPGQSRIIYRKLGSWHYSRQTFGGAAQLTASNDCDWDDAKDRKELAAGGGLYSAASLLQVAPAMWATHADEMRAMLERSYHLKPMWWLGDTAGMVSDTWRTVNALAKQQGLPAPELVRPDKAGAERFVRWVRSLPKKTRIQHRNGLIGRYRSYFGRTYPKALVDEELSGVSPLGYRGTRTGYGAPSPLDTISVRTRVRRAREEAG